MLTLRVLEPFKFFIAIPSFAVLLILGFARLPYGLAKTAASTS